MTVRCEKVHDYLKRERQDDEFVVLVDRVWPRGVCKEDLNYNEWAKDLAPSGELRRWFAHDPERWSGFQSCYLHELRPFSEERQRLMDIAARQTLTLLFSARDQKHNQAVVLSDWLENESALRRPDSAGRQGSN